MAANTIIYISKRETSNSSSEYALMAMRASDGALLWRNSSSMEMEAAQLIAEHDILYVLSRSHSLLEVNSVEAWKTDNGSFLWRNRLEGLGSGPLAMNQGIVYACCFAPHGICALRASTGDLLWRHRFDQDVAHCAALNGIVYIALHPETDADRGALVALRASNGVSFWRQPVDGEITAMAVHDECLYVGITNKTRQERPHAVDALRISDGTLLWRHHPKRGQVGNLIVFDGVSVLYSVNRKDTMSLVIPRRNEVQARGILEKRKDFASRITSSSESIVVALHAREGTSLWEYDGLDLGPIRIADGELYVGSASDIFILHPETGKLLKKYQIDNPVMDILVDSDMIYPVIQDPTISLKALQKGDGTTLWHTHSDPSGTIITAAIGMHTNVDGQEKTAAERPYPKEMNRLITEANKALVHRFFEEVLNKGDMTIVDELLESNYVSSGDAYLHELPSGLEGFKYLISLFHAAFPDGHFTRFTVQSHYAEEDLVITDYEWRGIYTGDLMGLRPTGNTFSFTGVSLFRIVNSKIVESWHSFDSFAAYILKILVGQNALR